MKSWLMRRMWVLGVFLAGTAAWADVYPDSPTIVWTDSGTGKLQTLKLVSGSTVQDLASGLSSPKGVSFNPALGRVYATNPISPPPELTLPLIRSCRLDGTDPGSFDAVGSSPRGLVSWTRPDPQVPGFFRDYWLWTDASSGTVYRRTGGHGGGLEPPGPLPPLPIIETGLVTPAGLALDAAHDGMFITDTGAGKLFWANQDGSDLTELLSGLGDPRDVVGHTNPDPYHPTPFVVWTDAAAGKVLRADLAYNSPPTVTQVSELITTGLVEPTGLALDLEHGRMFITDPGAGTIWQSNLDGSGLTALVTGLSDPWGIAYIVPEPGCLLMLVVGVVGLRRRRG